MLSLRISCAICISHGGSNNSSRIDNNDSFSTSYSTGTTTSNSLAGAVDAHEVSILSSVSASKDISSRPTQCEGFSKDGGDHILDGIIEKLLPLLRINLHVKDLLIRHQDCAFVLRIYPRMTREYAIFSVNCSDTHDGTVTSMT